MLNTYDVRPLVRAMSKMWKSNARRTNEVQRTTVSWKVLFGRQCLDIEWNKTFHFTICSTIRRINKCFVSFIMQWYAKTSWEICLSDNKFKSIVFYECIQRVLTYHKIYYPAWHAVLIVFFILMISITTPGLCVPYRYWNNSTSTFIW